MNMHDYLVVIIYCVLIVVGVTILDNFKIQLLTQNWIDNAPDDGRDFCSHGKVKLTINGIVICDDKSGDWTVASSALALMKSAIYRYDSKTDFELIPCCGYLRIFPSCPRYITWDTEINGNIISILNLQCSEVEEDLLKAMSRKLEIEYMEYVVQVLDFANKVIEFYASSVQRTFYDKWDEEQYELFWKEFNEYHEILVKKCSK